MRPVRRRIYAEAKRGREYDQDEVDYDVNLFENAWITGLDNEYDDREYFDDFLLNSPIQTFELQEEQEEQIPPPQERQSEPQPEPRNTIIDMIAHYYQLSPPEPFERITDRITKTLENERRKDVDVNDVTRPMLIESLIKNEMYTHSLGYGEAYPQPLWLRFSWMLTDNDRFWMFVVSNRFKEAYELFIKNPDAIDFLMLRVHTIPESHKRRKTSYLDFELLETEWDYYPDEDLRNNRIEALKPKKTHKRWVGKRITLMKNRLRALIRDKPMRPDDYVDGIPTIELYGQSYLFGKKNRLATIYQVNKPRKPKVAFRFWLFDELSPIDAWKQVEEKVIESKEEAEIEFYSQTEFQSSFSLETRGAELEFSPRFFEFRGEIFDITKDLPGTDVKYGPSPFALPGNFCIFDFYRIVSEGLEISNYKVYSTAIGHLLWRGKYGSQDDVYQLGSNPFE